MNHKASSMETWNAIAYGKSSRPVWFPRMRLWRLGFRCGGVKKSSGFSGRVAPHLCAPRRASGRLPLFLPRRPALRSQAPFACLGGSWEPGNPADPEHCISRAEAASRNRGLFLRNSPSFQATHAGPGRTLKSRCCGSSSTLPVFDTEPRLQPKNPL